LTSPAPDPMLGSFPTPLPPARPLAGILGSAPVEPGFYGENWGDKILVATNHRPTLVKLSQANLVGVTVLALQAGGFSPAAAVALGLPAGGAAEQALSDLDKQNPTLSGRLLVPVGLAGSLHWEAGQQVGHWSVQVVPDDISKTVTFLQQDVGTSPVAQSHLPAIIQRLITGLALWAGQALLVSIPLLVFGIQALVVGITSLFLSMLVLALFWKILPGPGLMKGLISGGVLALALVAVLAFVFPTSLLPAAGLLLSSLWMGLVFTGTRN
jgi:hypothetical protein